MAISSGANRAITEALTWVSAGVVLVGAVFFQADIRSALGLRYQPGQTASPTAASDTAPGRRESSGPAAAESTRGVVRLRADNLGHFNARAYINGDPVDVLVDTGATMVALTWDDARAAGVHVRDSDFTLRSQTANGTASFAAVTLDRVEIGDITVYDVRAAVARPGQLHRTLLGMSFLGQVRVEMRDRELLLSK